MPTWRPLRVIELITLFVLLCILGATLLPRIGGTPHRVSENPATAHPAKP